MNRKKITYIALCLATATILIGCGADIPNFSTESLDVTGLKTSQNPIGIGDTATIEASIVYSGDMTVLMYTWSVTGGKIRGSSNAVVYEAPTTEGVYTISVKVTDGTISSSKTIEIRVTQQSATPSLILDQNTYWSSEALKDKLSYDVNITKIATGKVLLHFEITQDKDEFDTFLSIVVGNQVVLPKMAIGAQLPSTGKVTVRDIDVSKIINASGRYMINLYIEPGNRAQDGWLLNEAKLVGVEGSSDPQQ
jgi:hypothetical protein